MFTRYSDIEIPQNYSGNRFSRQGIEDTTTKIHAPTIQGASKSSVSPSFEMNRFSGGYQDSVDNDDSEINDNLSVSEEIPTEYEGDFTAPSVDKDTNHHEFSQSLSQITGYLKKLKNDDLLLIGLIAFLASEKSVSNNDAIIILVLLLMYR